MLGSAFFGDQPVTSTQSPERARTRTEESSWAGSAGLVSGGAAAWCSVQLGNISSPGGNVGSSGSDSVRVAAMRFPSSRKYLWDRTPQGALTYVQFTVRAKGLQLACSKSRALALTLCLNLDMLHWLVAGAPAPGGCGSRCAGCSQVSHAELWGCCHASTPLCESGRGCHRPQAHLDAVSTPLQLREGCRCA